MEALNRDYRGTNPDLNKVPSYFAGLTADCGIEFQLAKIDPKGYATNGITRKPTNVQMFGVDDRIKSSKSGGDDAWDSNKYLNIWVCNIAGGVMGYTSPQGSPADKDGVVINYSAFGTIGTVSAPFNLGRTATHEIGHWLNLVHIWGDAFCGDDHVDDTPRQRSSNRGYLTGKKMSCDMTGHGDMYMNYMDLTNDACMIMFTKGQRTRMRAMFEKGGSRYALLFSSALQDAASASLPEGIALQPAPPAVSIGRLSVFPNPSSAEITLRRAPVDDDVTSNYIVYNYSGQPMMSGSLKTSSATINISALAAGIYFMKDSQSGAMVKFVKN